MRNFTTYKRVWLFLVSMASFNAFSEDPCIAYRNYVPLPDWYAKQCMGANRYRSIVGGGFSSYADAFNLNPATLPTHLMPLGFEVLLSKKTSVSDTKTTGVTENPVTTQFSLIKGLKNFGLGFSSDSEDTIYTNRPTPRKTANLNVGPGNSSYSQGEVLPNLNFGSALSLDSLFSGGSASAHSSVFDSLAANLGVIYRYGKASQTWSPGFGFTVNATYLSLGLSWIKESQTALFPEATVLTFNLGLRLGDLQLEYVHISNEAATQSATTTQLTTTTQIAAASFNLAGVLLSAAYRDSQDYSGQSVTLLHVGAKYSFTPKISLGYLYNYVPGAHSASLQVLF